MVFCAGKVYLQKKKKKNPELVQRTGWVCPAKGKGGLQQPVVDWCRLLWSQPGWIRKERWRRKRLKHPDRNFILIIYYLICSCSQLLQKIILGFFFHLKCAMKQQTHTMYKSKVYVLWVTAFSFWRREGLGGTSPWYCCS